MDELQDQGTSIYLKELKGPYIILSLHLLAINDLKGQVLGKLKDLTDYIDEYKGQDIKLQKLSVDKFFVDDLNKPRVSQKFGEVSK